MTLSLLLRRLHLLVLLAVLPAVGAELPAYPDTAPPGRLPDGVRPLAYTLDLQLDPREDAFTGTVTIDIALDTPGDHLWLHGKGLRVESARARLQDGRRIEARYEEVLDSGVARLSFSEALPAVECGDAFAPD
ncbi:MAG: hypothetical protein ACK2U9_07115, partial [Anaerolineae bacterium]